MLQQTSTRRYNCQHWPAYEASWGQNTNTKAQCTSLSYFQSSAVLSCTSHLSRPVELLHTYILTALLTYLLESPTSLTIFRMLFWIEVYTLIPHIKHSPACLSWSMCFSKTFYQQTATEFKWHLCRRCLMNIWENMLSACYYVIIMLACVSKRGQQDQDSVHPPVLGRHW